MECEGVWWSVRVCGGVCEGVCEGVWWSVRVCGGVCEGVWWSV